jgi:hypothetical protein
VHESHTSMPALVSFLGGEGGFLGTTVPNLPFVKFSMQCLVVQSSNAVAYKHIYKYIYYTTLVAIRRCPLCCHNPKILGLEGDARMRSIRLF